jgi:hypothetical protein
MATDPDFLHPGSWNRIAGQGVKKAPGSRIRIHNTDYDVSVAGPIGCQCYNNPYESSIKYGVVWPQRKLI